VLVESDSVLGLVQHRCIVRLLVVLLARELVRGRLSRRLGVVRLGAAVQENQRQHACQHVKVEDECLPSNLVRGAGDTLRDLVRGALGRLGSDLLLDLVREILAALHQCKQSIQTPIDKVREARTVSDMMLDEWLEGGLMKF